MSEIIIYHQALSEVIVAMNFYVNSKYIYLGRWQEENRFHHLIAEVSFKKGNTHRPATNVNMHCNCSSFAISNEAPIRCATIVDFACRYTATWRESLLFQIQEKFKMNELLNP